MNRLSIKRVSLVTSLILIGSIFAGCQAEYDNKGNDVTTTPAPVTTTIPKIEGEAMNGEIGTQTVNEDIAITIKNVYKLDIGGDDSEYTYIAFYVEIVNNSDDNKEYSMLSSFGIREQDATEDNNNLLCPSNTLLYVKRNTDFNTLNGIVAPGTMLNGVITIKIPKDFTEATFVFYPNISTTTGSILFKFTPSDLEDCPINE